MTNDIVYTQEWVCKGNHKPTGMENLPGTISTFDRATAEALAQDGIQLVKVIDAGELRTRYVFDGSNPAASNWVFAKKAIYTELMRTQTRDRF
jgi:hypothetical protein